MFFNEHLRALQGCHECVSEAVEHEPLSPESDQLAKLRPPLHEAVAEANPKFTWVTVSIERSSPHVGFGMLSWPALLVARTICLTPRLRPSGVPTANPAPGALPLRL